MGDKGGKKAKEKSQKQHTEKNKHKEQEKLDKQPKKKVWRRVRITPLSSIKYYKSQAP